MGLDESCLNDCDAVCEVLGLGEEGAAFRGGWDASASTFADGSPTVLSRPALEKSLELLAAPDEVDAAFWEFLPAFLENAPMLRLAWHCHRELFVPGACEGRSPRAWPVLLPESAGPCAAMFYAFVFLSAVPPFLEVHRQRGIPEDVTIGTLSDFVLWMREHKKVYGRWGFRQVAWMTRHFRGNLVQLGRLQFEMHTFPDDFHVLQRTDGSDTVVLPGDDSRFRADGQFDGANGIHDEDGAWVTEYRETSDEYVANAVCTGGKAVRRESRFPKPDWQEVVRQGDPTLSVHIPANGPLKHEACRDAYVQALEFFPKYFPEFAWKTFWCRSWLLDRQLQDLLPPESNIVRFLQDWRLLPAPEASDAQTIERAFGWTVKDPFQEPIRTSLQRTLIEHMRAGHRWRDAVGLILPGDISRA